MSVSLRIWNNEPWIWQSSQSLLKRYLQFCFEDSTNRTANNNYWPEVQMNVLTLIVLLPNFKLIIYFNIFNVFII